MQGKSPPVYKFASISLHLTVSVFILMGSNTGLILAKIVPSPLIRYAHENMNTRLECHNVSQSDEFYNFAKNVRWYRLVSGVRQDIEPSDRVYASSHNLFFDSFMRSDQGQYECCVPHEGCSGPASIVVVEADPVAEPVSTEYIGFEGHSVTLACRILNIGMPPARFYWERPDKAVINGDNITNDTHTLLILTNLTSSDSGEYRCVADGPLSVERHSVYLRLQVPPKVMMHGPSGMVQSGTEVQLTCFQLEGVAANISILTPSNTVIQQSMVTFNATPNDTGNYFCVASILSINVTASHYLHVYDIDNSTSLIQFVVEIQNDYCRHELIPKLRTLLENEILRLCRCNVTVISSGYQCIEYYKALYNVTITGFMAGNIKDFIEHSQLALKLDFQIAMLHVCNQTCSGMISNTNTTPSDGSDGDDESTSRHNNNLTSILAISFASCAMVLLCLILGVLVYKIKHTDKMTTYCVVCSYIHEKSVPIKTDSQICPGSIDHKCNLMNGDVPNESVPVTQSVLDTSKSHTKESVRAMKFKTTFEATQEQSVSRQDYFHHTDINRTAQAPHCSPEEVSAIQQLPSAFIALSDFNNNRIITGAQAENIMQRNSAIEEDYNNSRGVDTMVEIGTTTNREQPYKTSL